MIYIVILVVILLAIFGGLVTLFLKFKKYEPKLYAEILLDSGDTTRVEITDKEETFNHDGEEYNIKKNAIYQDHDILPRRTIKYIQGVTNPIRPEGKGENKEIKQDYITPVELNFLMGIEFDKLFSNETKNWKIPISKKYLILIGIAITVVVLLAIFMPRILNTVGEQTADVVREGATQHT